MVLFCGCVSQKEEGGGLYYKCPGCNVVFITIDSLRADHVGCYGYRRNTTPNIDSLSRKSMLFTKFYASIPETNPSHATIFTSKLPYQHKVQFNGQVLSEKETTLAEILAGEGYYNGAITGTLHLNNKSGLEQGFHTFDSGKRISARHMDTGVADDTTIAALEWLREHGGKRFFLWIHFFDPHHPYEPYRKYDLFQYPSLGGNPSRAEQLDWWINAYTTRYDGEVFGVDFNVGRILDYLEDNGLLNNTVVVVTSDHGEAFGEHDYYNDHGDLLYEDQVWIPLVIYDRGIALRSDRLSLNTQLMPTVLDILDITDSFSRAPSLFSDKRLPVLIFESDRCISPDVNNNSCYPVNSTVGKLIATRKGRFKYIHTPTKAGRVEELYDLESDVGELNNLTGSLGVESVLEELRQVVGGVEPLVHDPLNDVVQVDLETVEVLRSLGYVV